jgi:hypothetical protein
MVISDRCGKGAGQLEKTAAKSFEDTLEWITKAPANAEKKAPGQTSRTA